ncbi:hypothetical protein Tco_0194668 [Tanacetum coccineum]
MIFYLITLNLARFLNETAPQVEPPKEGKLSNAQAVQAVEAWKHSDFLCHNYVLNGLVDSFRCFEAFKNLMCHNYALYGLNDIKTEAMRESDLRIRHIFIALDIEKNHASEDMVNTMFASPGLSHGMWGKAIISATYLLDILVKKEIGRSSRINDEVVQDQRQQDDNDLQDER